MKNLKLFLLVLSVLSFSSCEKFLDTEPFTFTTVNTLYNTPANAELGLTGCYSALHNTWLQGEVGALLTGVGTDEAITSNGFADVNYSPFGLLGVTSQNETVRTNWANLFNAINRVNNLLESIDKTGVEESRKVEMIAEARFLRGLYYFYLAFNYGGVPLYQSAIHDENAPRASIKETYDLILADLTFAYENLPDRSEITGRANKWSAAGFLAKVYSYLASVKLNNVGSDLNFELNSFNWVDANSMYTLTKQITDDIIRNSDYELTEHYDYLFRETTKGQQDEESLFSLRAQTNSNSGNFICWVYWQIPSGDITVGGGFGVFRPTGELYFKYAEEDTRRAHNLTLYVNQTDKTEVIEGVTYYNPLPCLDPLRGDYSVGKFRYRDSREKTISSGIYWSDGNYSLLRYADILLLNAEAAYFLGDLSAARRRLKEVRIRSNSADIEKLTEAYYREDFLEELLDERSRELCFEGWRRFDLIRFGKFHEKIQGLSDNLGSSNIVVPILKGNLKTHSIWFPIPLSETELSPVVVQNPGY